MCPWAVDPHHPHVCLITAPLKELRGQKQQELAAEAKRKKAQTAITGDLDGILEALKEVPLTGKKDKAAHRAKKRITSRKGRQHAL